MFAKYLSRFQTHRPLVHNITNYVTVNDVANIQLAVGASPVMTDEAEDVAEMAAIADAVNLNIGTLNRRTIDAMFSAGATANRRGIPVVLDPVGAGATAFRTQTAKSLMEKIRFTVVRGNMSEMKALFGGSAVTRGVDADCADTVTEQNLTQAVEMVKKFARTGKTVVSVSGPIDLITDGDVCICVKNGRPEMERITGTGCMLTGLTAAFLGADAAEPLYAAAAAVCAMGVCGELAFARLQPYEGNATYRNRIIDAIYHLTPEQLEQEARYEIR